MEKVIDKKYIIPPELYSYSLLFFDYKSVCKFAQVSKIFQQLAEHDWRRRIKAEITAHPNLNKGQNYKQYYQRAYEELLLPITKLKDKNTHLAQGKYKDMPALHAAVQVDYPCEKIISSLLTDYEVNVNELYLDIPALIYPAERGDVKVAELLLKHGAAQSLPQKAYYKYFNFYGYYEIDPLTSLEAAVRSGNISLVELLIKYGATDLTCAKPNEDILFFAVQSQNPEMVSFILNYQLKTNLKDLKEAVKQNNFAIIQLLFEADTKLIPMAKTPYFFELCGLSEMSEVAKFISSYNKSSPDNQVTCKPSFSS